MVVQIEMSVASMQLEATYSSSDNVQKIARAHPAEAHHAA